MTDRRFLIFVRAAQQSWCQHGESEAHLSAAVQLANLLVAQGKAIRAQVFEVGGKDGVPHFIYRHGATNAA